MHILPLVLDVAINCSFNIDQKRLWLAILPPSHISKSGCVRVLIFATYVLRIIQPPPNITTSIRSLVRPRFRRGINTPQVRKLLDSIMMDRQYLQNLSTSNLFLIYTDKPIPLQSAYLKTYHNISTEWATKKHTYHYFIPLLIWTKRLKTFPTKEKNTVSLLEKISHNHPPKNLHMKILYPFSPHTSNGALTL